MKRFASFLILLLLSAQLDDYWAIAPPLASATLADDDNEYLPSQRRAREESADQKAAFADLQPRLADVPSERRALPFERNPATPFTPPPLYVLMSLQI
jgi:hypothetical protein